MSPKDNTSTIDNPNKDFESQVRDMFKKNHAFIIGIEDYSNLPNANLETAIDDARALAKLLRDYHGYTIYGPPMSEEGEWKEYPPRKKGEDPEFNSLPDPIPFEDSSKDQIEKILDSLAEIVKNEDERVLFYFAGHGIAIEKTVKNENGKEVVENKGYMVPSDARREDENSLVSFERLEAALNKLENRHGLLILDCCFGGAIKFSTEGTRDFVFSLPDVVYDERLIKYGKEKAWQVITSTGADQKAKDISNKEASGATSSSNGLWDKPINRNHSPFAEALIQALGKESDADLVPKREEGVEGDGLVSVNELFAYLQYEIKNIPDQAPQYLTLKNHGNGEYFFLDPGSRLNLKPIPNDPPFIGLSQYTESSKYLYFGFKQDIGQVGELLLLHPLIVLHGSSGIGKTSFLQAGLIPAMNQGGNWQAELVTIRPATDDQSIDEIVNTSASENLLIVIDVEDVTMEVKEVGGKQTFTGKIASFISPDELKQRLNSIENKIKKHLEAPASKVKFIISLRSEYILGEYGEFFQTIDHKKYKLGSEKDNEIKRVKAVCNAVTEKMAFTFIPNEEKENLLDKILNDIDDAPQPIVVFSMVMEKLYLAYKKDELENTSRENRTFIWEDYEALGGTTGILKEHAEAVYGHLNVNQKSTFKKLLLRMLTLNKAQPLEKVYSKDLEFSSEVDNKYMRELISLLLASRIIVSHLDRDHSLCYELIHPDLYDAWPELTSASLDQDGKDHKQFKLSIKLKKAVKNFLSNGTDPQKQEELLGKLTVEKQSAFKKYGSIFQGYSGRYSDLWQNKDDLKTMEAYLRSNENLLNKKEESFILASQVLKKRRRNFWTGIFILIGIALIILTIYAFIKRDEAIENEQKARTEQRRAEQRLNQILLKNYEDIVAKGDRYLSPELSLREYDSARYYWDSIIRDEVLILPGNDTILKKNKMDVLEDKISQKSKK